MDRVALLVEIELHPGARERFVERVLRHAASCLSQEPGCLEFTVLVPDDTEHGVILSEVYADQAALDAHLATPHMAAYLEQTGPWIARRQRRVCRSPARQA